MTISLVPDGSSQYPNKTPPPNQTWEGILGRGRVALSAGDGVDISQTAGALDVNIASGSVTIPAGASTEAKQDVQITEQTDQGLTLDDIETELMVQGTVLDAIEANQLPAGHDVTVDNTNGNPVPVLEQVVNDTPEAFRDVSFTAGESPFDLDLNTALGRNATKGFIICDGAGDIGVAFNSGAGFGDEYILKAREVYKFSKLSVDTIRITHQGVDSAYRASAV